MQMVADGFRFQLNTFYLQIFISIFNKELTIRTKGSWRSLYLFWAKAQWWHIFTISKVCPDPKGLVLFQFGCITAIFSESDAIFDLFHKACCQTQLQVRSFSQSPSFSPNISYLLGSTSRKVHHQLRHKSQHRLLWCQSVQKWCHSHDSLCPAQWCNLEANSVISNNRMPQYFTETNSCILSRRC